MFFSPNTPEGYHKKEPGMVRRLSAGMRQRMGQRMRNVELLDIALVAFAIILISVMLIAFVL
jgi:hypothetical protein